MAVQNIICKPQIYYISAELKSMLNNWLISSLLFTMLLLSTAVFSQDIVSTGGIRTVVIDPGHGGKDPGCLGKHSKEKSVTLAIGLLLGEYIEKKFPEVKVIYTRKTDVFVELDERAQIANRSNADLFICIHANAGPENAHGAETYVLGLHKTEAQRQIADRENAAIEFEADAGKKYEKLSADMIIARQLQLSVFLNHSIEFASRLQNQFVKIGRHDRGVRQAGFLVLYKTTMPSVLIETGFLSNAAEEKFLADTASQRKMANSMFTAFEDYKVYYDAASTGIVKQNDMHKNDIVQSDLKETDVNPDEIVYRVQILTSVQPLKKNDPALKGMETWSYVENEMYKHTVGIFRSIEDANTTKTKMREQGFDHAFVVAFMNGKRITMEEASKIPHN